MIRKLAARITTFAMIISGTMARGASIDAQAVLYDNTPVPTSGFDLVSIDGPLYDSFSTGSAAADLLDVRLLLAGDPISAASFTVSLFSSVGTFPGPMLGTVGRSADSQTTISGQAVDFPVSALVRLAADTRYWIGLKTDDDSTVGWGYGQYDDGVGVTGEYWNYSPAGSAISVFDSDFDAPYQMAVTASLEDSSTVSEPSGGALFLLGATALGAARLNGQRQTP